MNENWTSYGIIATGGGEKLERWGDVVLLRPDPQVIWPAKFDLSSFKGLNARYVRSENGGGAWRVFKKFADEWTVDYRDLKFLIKPMGFKHTGLFPEQAHNWDKMTNLVKYRQKVNVLNLFAYTGGATAALAKAGAHVTHVDAAKNMVERAKTNAALSKVKSENLRFIVDDCKKFVEREIKRGKRYDAVIMDPPSYGRGPSGEMWKLEDNLYDLVKLTSSVLSDNPLFYLINGYTTGLGLTVTENILRLALNLTGGKFESYENTLPTDEGIKLPCGGSSIWSIHGGD